MGGGGRFFFFFCICLKSHNHRMLGTGLRECINPSFSLYRWHTEVQTENFLFQVNSYPVVNLVMVSRSSSPGLRLSLTGHAQRISCTQPYSRSSGGGREERKCNLLCQGQRLIGKTMTQSENSSKLYWMGCEIQGYGPGRYENFDTVTAIQAGMVGEDLRE